MKKIFKYISLLFIPVLFMVSCTPEEYELGEVDVTSDELVEGIAFEIVHDADNPNIVYLKSLMDDKYTPLWNHPQGRSQKHEVELKMPFEGTYSVQFGVETRGGIVYGDTVTFEVEDFYAGFISDPLWELITGGVGESKTWVLDLFPEEEAPNYSKYFSGPLYFYDPFFTWENVAGGKDVEYPEGTTSEEGWGSWQADWAGTKDWLFGGSPAEDYGTMTFDLINGANLTVNHKVLGRQETGTFMLDVDNHTLKTNDAYILHDESRDGQVVDWGDVRILSLTENTMQLAVVRDEALSGEGPSLLCYNFISKEYSDNWVPGEVEEPEPTLPEGWKEDISKTVNTAITWKLSESNPLDWANLDGSMMNGWQAPEDYPDWLGTPDPSVYGDFSMTLNSANNSVTFVTPDGTTSEGTYELSEKGIYSFDVDVPSFAVIGWASFAADANNELRILQIEKDAAGSVTGMWIGARSSDKDEYMAYHLVPSGGSGGSNEPQGTEVAFDNSKLAFGDLEENGNLRLELYNEYGSTAGDPPLAIEDLASFNSVEVTFTLSGITLNEGAAGSYDASVYYADSDWNPGGNGDAITVNGDGTYTVSFNPGSTIEGVMVFVIDVAGMGTDIADMTAVTATIDNVKLF
jgi:hypothetical protein